MWLRRADRDGFSVKAGRKKGRADPEWTKDEPEEPPGCDLFWIAFRDLQTERHPDGAIPWSACRLYTRDKGLSPELGEVVWDVIRALDLADNKWRVEEARREAGQGGNVHDPEQT